MDFALTTEQNLLVDSLRAFVAQELYPYEEEVEQSGELRPELAARMAHCWRLASRCCCTST